MRLSQCGSSSLKNSICYINQREHGRHSMREKQFTADSLVSNRKLRPFLADTPINSHTTYLVRLNCDKNIMAAAHGDCSVVIYCPISGKSLINCYGHPRPAWALDFHPTMPHILATGCLGGDVRLWDLQAVDSETGVSGVKCVRMWKHTDMVSSLAFHPTYPILAATQHQDIMFYDWSTGHHLCTWRFVSSQSRVRWLRFSNDGSLLYTATVNPHPRNRYRDGISAFTSDEASFSRERGAYNLRSLYMIDDDELPLPIRSPLPSRLLLDFLMGQTDDWFTYRGFCETCPIRICRWAACLGAPLPHSHMDLFRGLRRANAVAKSVIRKLRVAGLPLNRLVRWFTDGKTVDDVGWRATGDPHPVTVAIIEDIPVREFLLSLGEGYCSNPTAPFKRTDKICCGAHARDMISLHRELMRHSLCRSCLNVFWRWAVRTVDWWPRTTSGNETSTTNFEQRDAQSAQPPPPPATSSNSPEQRDPMGLCIRCHSSMVSRKKDKLSVTRPADRIHSALASLELLRGRLRNVKQATPLTYRANDILTRGKLDDYFRNFFKNAAEEGLSERREPNSEPTRDTSNEDAPSPDRNGPPLTDRVITPGTSVEAEGPRAPPGTSVPAEEIEQIDPNLPRQPGNSPTVPPASEPEAQENRPADSSGPFKFFDFIPMASRLLSIKPEDVLRKLSPNASEETRPSEERSSDDTNFPRTCCLCGSLVPQLVPVTSQSTLSEELCKDLILCPNSAPPVKRTPRESSTSDEEPRPSLRALINNTSSQSLLNVMQRTVTQVISDILGNLGEHASASNMQNLTHRVCKWKLNLYGPMYDYNGRITRHALRPMPIGFAASYARGSLIVPHVRLFNDSSIGMSPDGKHLAAFIVPKAYTNHSHPIDDSGPDQDTTLAVYRLEPEARLGQCVFLRSFDSCTPVCLDFSPVGDYLAVGMASSQLPVCVNSAYLTAINDSLMPNSGDPQQQFLVAQVFRLREYLIKEFTTQHGPLPRVLLKTGIVRHPSLLDPVSCSREETLNDTTSHTLNPLDNWHRLLLSTPTGISLNTILWNPSGGLVYGTTKGLIILMKCQPFREGDDSDGQPPAKRPREPPDEQPPPQEQQQQQ